jgi:lipopolysaccharide export system protein LptA
MTLVGKVVLTQDGNVLRADKVVTDLTTHKTVVTSPSRIAGHFEGMPAGAGPAAPTGLASLGSSQSATDVSADRLEISEDGNQALFQGTVQVSQSGNKLAGERLDIDVAKRHMTLSGPGRVTGLFQGSAAKPAKSVAAKALGTDPIGLGHSFTALSAGSSGPTSIEADTMTVEDDRGQATFSGKVVVVRGDSRITANSMTALYSHAKSGPSTGRQLVKISAKDKVLITMPDRQSARGDWLLYEADRDLLTMGGNVTVTQGDNIIHGDKLVVNLETGESHFETKPVAGVDGSDGPQALTAPKSGRIQVLITPQGIKQIGGQEANANPPPKVKKQKTGSSASDVMSADPPTAP